MNRLVFALLIFVGCTSNDRSKISEEDIEFFVRKNWEIGSLHGPGAWLSGTEDSKGKKTIKMFADSTGNMGIGTPSDGWLWDNYPQWFNKGWNDDGELTGKIEFLPDVNRTRVELSADDTLIVYDPTVTVIYDTLSWQRDSVEEIVEKDSVRAIYYIKFYNGDEYWVSEELQAGKLDKYLFSLDIVTN